MTESRQLALNGTPLTDSEKLPNGFSDITTKSATDLTRWRLLNERGRHTWHYLTTDEAVQAWPQSIADKHFLGLPVVSFYPSLGLLCAYAGAKLIWAGSRIFQTFPRPRLRWKPRGTQYLLLLIFSSHRVIGRASMAGPCSSYRVWSLPGM